MTQTTLFVCVLCRFSASESKAVPQPGQTLFDELRKAIEHSDAINLQSVRCMGACQSACVAAFAAPNKLTFVLSNLSPTESVSDLLQFGRQHASCTDGKVPYKERPETIKQKIHAVLPLLPNNNP
ncbi:DUF1636 domain-containing protein [Leptolyngbya sp. AN03gr2]|uniref:DUF1636 domain-containing protein n=1 Tax=unclassified Leptolyngbya TaxID=2650499 RepID=UPI003D3153A4